MYKMRWLLTLLAWLVSTIVLVPVCFVVVIVLAGPHSSMLPSWIQPAVLVLGWVVLVVGPLLVARAVWRRRAHAH